MSGTAGFVDGPIVPWTMNSASGTRGVGINFLINQGGAPSGFNPDTQILNGGPCTQHLGGAPNSIGLPDATLGSQPLENDIKQLVNDHGANGTGLSTDPNNRDNPNNWIWWGSFGVLNAFSYTSKISGLGGPVPSVSAGFLPVSGLIPSGNRVFADTLGPGLGRTLFHVTRKADADCPHSVPGDGVCNFGIAGPALQGGGNDLNVTGGTAGVPGAIREFTRFLCRVSTNQSGPDPLTGVNNFTEISNAITAAGFQSLNSSIATPNSRCAVQSS
jgi:hypothetical protein